MEFVKGVSSLSIFWLPLFLFSASVLLNHPPPPPSTGKEEKRGIVPTPCVTVSNFNPWTI